MKNLKYFLVILLMLSSKLLPQQLPLRIGNEWHYTYGLGPAAPYIAAAVDTVRINNILFYKIERWDINTKEVSRTTYDRIDGDSLYYRIYGDSAKLIFNFNWEDRHIESSPNSDDSTCDDLKLIKRDKGNIWGITTDIYSEFYALYCSGMPDTGWTLSDYQYSKYFGCLNAMDGLLAGAKIDGITYGILHPTPVELESFSRKIFSNSVELKWSTAAENNNYGFEILRSNSEIGFVRGNGTITGKNNYIFRDDNLMPGEYIYKIMQIDYNGDRKKIAEIEVSISAPVQYDLSQNYPNPFNPVTTIDFQIPEAGFVNIKVFDCLGNEVRTLMNEFKSEGIYKLKFDASDLPGGIYFYRIKSNNFLSTKKMLLLK